MEHANEVLTERVWVRMYAGYLNNQHLQVPSFPLVDLKSVMVYSKRVIKPVFFTGVISGKLVLLGPIWHL